VFTDSAIDKFTEQLKQTGASYDWSKTIKTSDPNYTNGHNGCSCRCLTRDWLRKKKA